MSLELLKPDRQQMSNVLPLQQNEETKQPLCCTALLLNIKLIVLLVPQTFLLWRRKESHWLSWTSVGGARESPFQRLAVYQSSVQPVRLFVHPEQLCLREMFPECPLSVLHTIVRPRQVPLEGSLPEDLLSILGTWRTFHQGRPDQVLLSPTGALLSLLI